MNGCSDRSARTVLPGDLRQIKSHSVDDPQTSGGQCLNDEEAMLRLRSGDPNALSYLLERHSRLVFNVARRIVQDFGEAEEIVQDVFFQIYQKAELFDPLRGTTKAWILQMAFHRSLDRKSYLARRGFYSGANVEELSDTLSENRLGSRVGRQDQSGKAGRKPLRNCPNCSAEPSSCSFSRA